MFSPKIFWVSLIIEGALEVSAIALILSNNMPGVVPGTSDKRSNLHIRVDALGTFFSVMELILWSYNRKCSWLG
jgi:hypothetical protein